MPESVMKKMHLPLPPDMHARLKQEAESSGIPTTAIAREAVGEWLARRERARIAEELHAFAIENAGSELDLDEDFEDAAAETLAKAPR